MKINRRIAGVGVMTLLLSAVAAFALMTEPPGRVATSAGKYPSEKTAAIAIADSQERTEVRYVLKAADGQVGIYDPADMEKPKTLTGIAVSKLRAADAAQLAQGIEVAGDEELARLLEDFGS